MLALPKFRNDDVSFDTELKYFTQFCDIFHKHGFTQVHAVTIKGLCNHANTHEGKHCTYKGYSTLNTLPNTLLRSLSEPYHIKENKELVKYLNSIPDEIALHGFFHEGFSALTEEEQYENMEKGLNELYHLFPNKKISYFVPPFNRRNAATHRAAHRLDLRILGDEGVHFEESLENLILEPGVWYRYHHHRFYPTTKYKYFTLSLEKLDQALFRAKQGLNNGTLPIPSHDYEGSIALLQQSVNKHNVPQEFVTDASERLNKKELAAAMGWIFAHIPYNANICELGSGIGNNLFWLTEHGYTNLTGIDSNKNALAVAHDMANLLKTSWALKHNNILELHNIPKQTQVVLAMNCLSLLPEFNLKNFLKQLSLQLSDNIYIILDLINDAFNYKYNNEYNSADWNLSQDQEKRPSEYKHRFSTKEVDEIADQCGFIVTTTIPIFQNIPRYVYVLTGKNTKFVPRRPLTIPKELLEPKRQNSIEFLSLSKQFDEAWYRAKYGSELTNMPALEHYVRLGANKGYNPSSQFHTSEYRKKYMAIDDTTNPLLHALLHSKIK